MNTEELVNLVDSYIQAKIDSGGEFENAKVDFKRKWSDLTNAKGKDEFLKDTSAIANTFGPDGYIIIGFDPKNNSFHSAKFSDCGLTDESKLQDLIIKRIAHAFRFEIIDLKIGDNGMSVVHIYPSFDKPHVIRSYKGQEHVVFVRSGTTTRRASKNDFELMYWDRKNIQPEYELWLSLFHPSINFIQDTLYIGCKMSIENLGRRPVHIRNIEFEISYPKKLDPYRQPLFRESDIFLNEPPLSIIIETNNIHVFDCKFKSHNEYRLIKDQLNLLLEKFKQYIEDMEIRNLNVVLSNHEVLFPKVMNKNGLIS